MSKIVFLLAVLIVGTYAGCGKSITFSSGSSLLNVTIQFLSKNSSSSIYQLVFANNKVGYPYANDYNSGAMDIHAFATSMNSMTPSHLDLFNINGGANRISNTFAVDNDFDNDESPRCINFAFIYYSKELQKEKTFYGSFNLDNTVTAKRSVDVDQEAAVNDLAARVTDCTNTLSINNDNFYGQVGTPQSNSWYFQVGSVAVKATNYTIVDVNGSNNLNYQGNPRSFTSFSANSVKQLTVAFTCFSATTYAVNIQVDYYCGTGSGVKYTAYQSRSLVCTN